jgi:hypothetical protein
VNSVPLSTDIAVSAMDTPHDAHSVSVNGYHVQADVSSTGTVNDVPTHSVSMASCPVVQPESVVYSDGVYFQDQAVEAPTAGAFSGEATAQPTQDSQVPADVSDNRYVTKQLSLLPCLVSSGSCMLEQVFMTLEQKILLCFSSINC